MTKKLVLSRPLSLSEHFLRSRTATRFYNNFQVTGTYSQNISSHLIWVYMALRKSLLDYPILICNIQREKDDCVFRPINSAKLGDIVELSDIHGNIENGAINEKFMKYLNTISFDLYSETPLFKLVILGEHVSAVFEHTITDGLVGPYFHEIFLKNLDYVSNESNCTEYEILYGKIPTQVNLDSTLFNFEKDQSFFTHSLPPPSDIFVEDPELDFTYGDPDYHEKAIPEGYETKWPGRFEPTHDQSIGYKLVHFDPDEAKQLVDKCRSQGTTLTPFIQVVHVLTMQPIYGDKHYTSHRMAITLRRHAKPENVPDYFQDAYAEPGYKLLGGWAHVGPRENYPPLFEFSWDKVKEIHRNLVADTNNTRLYNIYQPFKNVYSKTSNNDEFFQLSMQAKADATKLSNLGFINFPVYKSTPGIDWTVNNLVFSQDVSAPTADFVYNIISTPLGGLNIVVSFQDHRSDDLSNESLEGLVAKFRHNLLFYSEK
ncbi:alcohol acetyltransferase [Scheffersomyces amazonensis]|uniref:alcohol acetyltransferase n=1 Tax=Scheffersomyces amazonensis TaxID=1078765 RepID=UPI00315CCBA4